MIIKFVECLFTQKDGWQIIHEHAVDMLADGELVATQIPYTNKLVADHRGLELFYRFGRTHTFGEFEFPGLSPDDVHRIRTGFLYMFKPVYIQEKVDELALRKVS